MNIAPLSSRSTVLPGAGATHLPALTTLVQRPIPLHTIRLRSMWTCDSSGGAPAEPGQSVADAEDLAATVWGRSFGQPIGLARDERVALVVTTSRRVRKVVLNGVCLADCPPRRELAFDISSLLKARNNVSLEIVDDETAVKATSHDASAISADSLMISSFPGDVRLEIYREPLPTEPS